MDKETLGQYGWLVVCVIILAIMITLATPFGSVIRGEVEGIVTNFKDTATTALDGIEAETDFGGGGSGGSGGSGGGGSSVYTQEDITNSGGKLVAIGKTNPLYVVAAFNDDYTSLTITKNGADSDGKIKDFVTMTEDHPFLADYHDVATVVVEEGITYIGDQTFFQIGSTPATLSLPASLTGVGSGIYDNSFVCDMTINYAGTIAQYEELFASCGAGGYTVHCTDGDVTI